VEKQQVQITEYILNLTALRVHFHIGTEPMSSGLNLGDSVDEGAMTGDGAPADEQMEADEEDDDDLEPEELGRRMRARGDAPPSPNAQNDRIRRGYDEAVRAAATTTAAANSPAAAPSSAAVRFTVGSLPLRGNEMSQEAIDKARAERQQQQQAKGKQRASASVAGGPPAKKQRHGTTAAAGGTASVALVHKGCVLLTRETRKGKTLFNLPGGKGEAGETLGATAAREAHEETGMQLTERTRAAIAAIADWVECGAGQGRAGALTLADDDPDGAVDTRFDHAAANAQGGGSKTVHVGLEWHALAEVRLDAWRRQHMHFPGQHRAAGAVRALDRAGAGPSGAAGGVNGAGGLNLGGAVAGEE
jgi:8-oxo-dGTP pyrophosphatase MutT (NUDIX family)